MDIVGYLLALLVGVSLGLIGSGGSILAVPILHYVMGVPAEDATAYSLFIVGVTALAGSTQNTRQQQIDYKAVVTFGLPSIVAVYATRTWLLPHLPQQLLRIGGFTLTKPVALLLLFAIVMLVAAISMIRNGGVAGKEQFKRRHLTFIINGLVVGLITGLVGAGGGFLIIPALVITGRMPVKKAIATSLAIIAVNALTGFTGDLISGRHIQWPLLLIFTVSAVAGIFVGMRLARKIEGEQLKKLFGWMVLLIGCYIILKELFL